MSEEEVPGAPRPPSRRRASKATRWRLVVVGVLLVGAIGFLLVEGLGSSLDFYDTIPQALHDRAELAGKTFRLDGVVVPGTIHRVPGGIDFDIEGGGIREPVVAHALPSQIFQPGIAVVLVGHFSGNHFWSDEIMEKHSSTYTPVKEASHSPGGAVRSR